MRECERSRSRTTKNAQDDETGRSEDAGVSTLKLASDLRCRRDETMAVAIGR